MKEYNNIKELGEYLHKTDKHIVSCKGNICLLNDNTEIKLLYKNK